MTMSHNDWNNQKMREEIVGPKAKIIRPAYLAYKRYKRNFQTATRIANAVASTGLLPPQAYPLLSLVNFANGDFGKWNKYRMLANGQQTTPLLLTS